MAAVKRMIEDNVYPKTVEIAPDALKVAMTTQIAIGNLAEQPVYEKSSNGVTSPKRCRRCTKFEDSCCRDGCLAN
jgi:hypothetical protein